MISKYLLSFCIALLSILEMTCVGFAQQDVSERGKGASTVSYVFDGGSVVYSYYDTDLMMAKQFFLVHPMAMAAKESKQNFPVMLIRNVFDDTPATRLSQAEAIAWVDTRVKQLESTGQKHDSAFLAAVLFSTATKRYLSIGGERAVQLLRRGRWLALFKE